MDKTTTQQEQGGFWDDAEIISVYTRAQAIEDGILVDLSQFKEPAEAGFKFPMACTAAVWALIDPSDMAPGNSITGRLWDLCWMMKNAARRARGSVINFRVIFTLKARNGRWVQRETALKAVCGPGDTPEPVLTVMLPDED